MARRRPPPPCDRKCPLRTSTCHSTCPDFKDWRAVIDADNALRKAYWESQQDVTEEHREAVIRAGQKNKAKKAH